MKTETYEPEVKTGGQSRPPSNDKPNPSKSNPEGNREEMMKKMQAAATPGLAHKSLNHFVGEWKADVKMWMEPGAAPKESQGSSSTRWILNGHFLEEEFKGEMAGKPFYGRWLIGYDNTKQKFNSVWVDDCSTSMSFTEGTGENDNKVITLEGKTVCSRTGRKDLPLKQVFRIESPDKHVVEMFVEGKKNLEITYTRQ
jgi:Protein of unknown function (DUF1579)